MEKYTGEYEKSAEKATPTGFLTTLESCQRLENEATE